MDPSKTAPPPETKLHFLDYWRIIRIRKTVILAVFLLVVITATLVTFVLPVSYASTARIKIDRDRSDIELQQTGNAMGFAYDPYFIQTEFEVIQSELILDQVIERLRLREVWGKTLAGGKPLKTEEARRFLKSKIDLATVRGTSLIAITVYSEKPEEAAEIANMIADVYSEYRREERVDMSKRGIKSLLERVDLQQKKIEDFQKRVEDLRQQHNISDLMASADAPAPLIETETLRRLTQLKYENQAEYERQKTLLDSLKALKPEELVQALPRATQDALLSTWLEQRSLAEQQLLAVEKDYGEEHVTVIKAKAMVADLNKKVNEGVAGAMLALESRVNSTKQYINALDEQVKEAERQDIAKATESRPYFDAKRELNDAVSLGRILQMRIATEEVDQNLPKTVMVKIVDSATPGTSPVKPNKPLNIALGVIIGLIVGIGLAFFIEYLDTSVKTIDDVERALQAPVLGVIPQNVGLMIEEGIESPHAEAYRVLRTNLLFSRKDDKLNTIAVVSAGAGEGKSTTVFNLAAVFAQSGQRVVVVDSDLRRPTLHKMLKVTNSIGLTNYLLKQNSLEEVIQTSAIPTLDFMASGKLPSSSLGILSSLQMRDLINELKQRYDFVFFDSPPIMGVSDASILASAVDMTLQVIQYRRYPQPMNIRAKQLIEKVGGNLVGIVLNNINMSQDESYYYYSGYYHDYYYAHREETPAPTVAARNGGSETAAEPKDRLDINPKY